MNKIFNKLCSRKGESLIESLAAILVMTLASIVMYSMVTAAADINTKAKNNDLAIQQQMDVAERADRATGEGTIYMYIEYNDEQNKVAEVDVDIFGIEGGLFSYFAKEVSGG